VISLLVALVSVAQSAYGTSGPTWTVGERGILDAPGLTNSYFKGSCTFLGDSGGTGSCAISEHFQRSTQVFTCQIAVTATSWTFEPIQTGGANGFWITSGSVVATAQTQSEASFCASRSVPPGALDSSGVIVNPIDTRVPGTPGTYAFGKFGQLPTIATVTVKFSST
jgi:hypothetical protein